MKSSVSLLSVLGFCVLFALVQVQAKQQQSQSPGKLKRDAGLSFGGGSYHGPSHKYLPPGPGGGGGFEGGYSGLHGNGLASASGFDFGSLDSDSYHHHHGHHGSQRPVYSGYHHHPSPGHHQGPKVETYIVQTTSHGGGAHGHGHGHGYSGSSSSGGGYKYVSSSPGAGSAYLGLQSGYLVPGSGAAGHFGGQGVHHQHHHISSRPIYASSHSHGHHSHGLGLGLDLSSLTGHSPAPSGYHYGPPPPAAVEEPAGYSYEAPFAKPLTSYGVPLLPGYEHEHKEQGPVAAHHEEQTPAYALGHKGLGHFSYTASKPHALHTDVIGLTSAAAADQGHHQDHHQDHNELAAEISKAPFRPSAFLGAKHETSSSGSGAGYDYATPTSGGYDYQPPAVLYGAPSHSGDSATPIFEPEATYLPPSVAPQLSYGGAASSPAYHH